MKVSNTVFSGMHASSQGSFWHYQSEHMDFDARIPSRKPSYEDAVVIHGRLMRREFQSRIAADYDCSQGRISEIKNHKLHPGSYEEALSRTKH